MLSLCYDGTQNGEARLADMKQLLQLPENSTHSLLSEQNTLWSYSMQKYLNVLLLRAYHGKISC
jgi:hypothetical protein